MIRPDVIQHILTESRQRRALEVEERALSLIESLHDQLDPEMRGWHFAGGIGTASETLKTIEPADLDTLRKESRKAYYRHPYGRNLVNSYVKFVIGKGIIVDFQEKNKEALAAIIKYWNGFKKANKWFSLQREAVTRSLRDGEFFIRQFPMLGSPPILRFIDPENVNSPDSKAPDGIETDPDDVEAVIAYHVQKGMSHIKVPANEVIHHKLGVDRNVRRGRPLLESMLGYLTKYDKWLDARIVLNLVRTSFALVRHVKGAPTNISTLRSAIASNKTTPTSETDKSKMLRPGTIISATPGVDYEMIGPNLEARDAAQDGRTILMALAAGGGLPDVFVTMDFSNSNFASTVVAQNPAIRTFEEHEEIYSEPFSEMITWCLEDGVRQGLIPATVTDEDGNTREINLDHNIAYPPLLKRDLLNEVNAWEKMMALRISSGRTASLNLGLNPDQEGEFLDEENPDKPAGTRQKPKRVPKRVEDREPRDDVMGADPNQDRRPSLSEEKKEDKMSFRIDSKLIGDKKNGKTSFRVDCELLEPQDEVEEVGGERPEESSSSRW